MLHGYDTFRHAGSRFTTYGCLSSLIRFAVNLWWMCVRFGERERVKLDSIHFDQNTNQQFIKSKTGL